MHYRSALTLILRDTGGKMEPAHITTATTAATMATKATILFVPVLQEMAAASRGFARRSTTQRLEVNQVALAANTFGAAIRSASTSTIAVSAGESVADADTAAQTWLSTRRKKQDTSTAFFLVTNVF